MDDAVTSYTYDGYNNRIGKVENGVQTSYLYDNRNRLTQESVTENGQTAVTSYQYDPNGNLYSRQTLTYGDNTIQEPKASAVLMGYTAETNDMLLEYNNFNQLTTVTKGDEIVTYDYYANGLRKSKTVDGYTTTHIWDGQNMAGEITGDDFTGYLRGARLIARKMGDNTQYYHFNGHSDTLSMTDENGAVLQNYTYDAFGNLENLHGLDTNPFRYCGEYYDVETGFIYLRNRYYDPSMGRFISEDPVRDGLNWYAYCGNNPVMFVDPWGLEYIAVSGGRYSHTTETGYEFIETAIKKLREWKELADGENITWMVANAGWNKNDINKFKEVAKDIGVNFKLLDNTDDFVNYVNKKNGNDRYNDKIKKIAVYSHGKDTNGGTIELGYYHDNAANLKISVDTIKKQLWATAFENPNAWFGACNLGNIDGNFLEIWNQKFGGKTWGYAGKTTYEHIWKNQTMKIKWSRLIHGFSYYGSGSYPEAGVTKMENGSMPHMVFYGGI